MLTSLCNASGNLWDQKVELSMLWTMIEQLRSCSYVLSISFEYQQCGIEHVPPWFAFIFYIGLGKELISSLFKVHFYMCITSQSQEYHYYKQKIIYDLFMIPWIKIIDRQVLSGKNAVLFSQRSELVPLYGLLRI